MNIAFFDFDGTITTSDTLFRFIRFSKGAFRFFSGLFLLSPVFLFFKLGLIPNWRAKEMVLSWFFRGVTEEKLQAEGKRFSDEVIPGMIRPEAEEAITLHHRNGDVIVVVTASLSFWIKPWSDSNKLDLLATEPEFANGIFTGRFSNKNCFGPEKVRRIREAYNLTYFDKIYAYGDSAGDLDMLNLADEKYLKWNVIA